MADSNYIAVVAKIAGLLTIGDESVTDSEINLTNTLSVMLTDSLSRDLDLGLLNGGGPPEPFGVIGAAGNIDAPDLLTGVSQAIGAINDAGGMADTLAVSGAILATEDAKVGANGLFYPGGCAAAVGLKALVVPALATPVGL